MKIKRHKKAQKILAFFQHNFALQAPYTILLDATFCHSALEGKVLIKEQIPKYLGAQTKIVTTQCIILEVEKLSKISPKLYGTWLVVKQFPVHKCGHEGDPVPASSCAKSLLGKNNPGKYIMASQDPELRAHVHQEVVGTPILYLHQSAPTLEKPTKKCVAAAQGSTLSTHEEATLKTLKRKHLGEAVQEPPRKRKKAKNPHSLSCKKSKKVKQADQQKASDGKRKRKRHKRKGRATKSMSGSE